MPLPVSGWSRKWWRGSATWTTPAPGPFFTVFQGVSEHAVYATNCDALVDLTNVIPALGWTLFVRIYAQTAAVRVYCACYQLNILGGVVPFPLGRTNGSATQSGSVFLVQAGGVAANIWGIDVAITGTSYPFTLNGIFIASIAHGREL